jgi:hypothetical protein
MKVKSIKPVDKVPIRGIYTKTAKTIVTEFQKTNHGKAEVNIEEEEKGEILRLYNAMKSYLRRENLKIECSVNVRQKKLYLYKA